MAPKEPPTAPPTVAALDFGDVVGVGVVLEVEVEVVLDDVDDVEVVDEDEVDVGAASPASGSDVTGALAEAPTPTNSAPEGAGGVPVIAFAASTNAS